MDKKIIFYASSLAFLFLFLGALTFTYNTQAAAPDILCNYSPGGPDFGTTGSCHHGGTFIPPTVSNPVTFRAGVTDDNSSTLKCGMNLEPNGYLCIPEIPNCPTVNQACINWSRQVGISDYWPDPPTIYNPGTTVANNTNFTRTFDVMYCPTAANGEWLWSPHCIDSEGLFTRYASFGAFIIGPSLSATLTANPPSGLAPLTTNLTPNVTSNILGPTNYYNPTCGLTGGTISNINYTTGTFTCTYSSPGTYSPQVYVKKGATQVTAATTVTVNAPTLNATLTANPSSGLAPLTSNITTTVSGTATGTITYSAHSCGGGTISNISNGSFTCSYATAGTYTTRVTVTRQGLTANPTTNVVVSALTLTATLAANPSSGQATLTSNLTATVGGTATGTITYSAHSCGGGTISNINGASFTCTYSAAGTYTARMTVTRQGLTVNPLINISVSSPPTVTASLAASPASGTATLISNLNTTVGGTATGTITYSGHSCGGGVISNISSGSFMCTYASAGTYTPSITVTRQGVSATGTTTIMANPASTLNAALTANPTSGTATLTSNLTTAVGGTATGVITYSNHSCGGGVISNISSGSFTCTYTTAGTYTALISVTRQGLTVNATTNITVTNPPTLTATLTANPASGTAPLTSNLTTTVGGTAAGTITYSNHSCGGGIISGISLGTFNCTYSSVGTYTASVSVNRQGLNVAATTTITVSAAPTLNATLTPVPASGNTPLTSNLTTVVGGTATGVITYSNHSCGGGIISSINQGSFSCTYATGGTYTASITVARQGLIITVTANIVVTNSTLTAILNASPTSGNAPLTSNLTTTVGGTATGTITYSNHNCGGGTISGVSGGSFSCNYPSVGAYNVSIDVSRGGLNTTGTATITATCTYNTCDQSTGYLCQSATSTTSCPTSNCSTIGEDCSPSTDNKWKEVAP